MKTKEIFLGLMSATIALLLMVSCSDYDNGYTENAIKFTEEFKKAYGDIDPEQDWNLAERATVTVNTQHESNIKIYALRGNEYVLVGDYKSVNGTQQLGIDLVEGTRHLIVSDGTTAQQCTPGSVIAFSSLNTRAAHVGTTGDITVSKITNENGQTLDNGVTYPMYKYATEDDYEAMKAVIPEIDLDPVNYRKHTNLPKVTHDFKYVSNGQFIVYPYYWETSSNNEIGLYYREGEDIKYVPIYTIKSGDELQYSYAGEQFVHQANLTDNITTDGEALYWPEHKALCWTASWSNCIFNTNLPTGNLLQRFTHFSLKGTFKGKTKSIRLLFYKTGSSESKAYELEKADQNSESNQDFNVTINLQSLVEQDATWKDYLENCSEVRISGGSHSTDTFKNANGDDVIGDVQFDYVQFEYNSTNWVSYQNQNFCSQIFSNNLGDMVRGQGIVVDIPKGREFGMYLKKGDGTGTFYSQSELNDPAKVGRGIIDDGVNDMQESDALFPCYASTFHVGEQMFLGFEDWPNNQSASDFDLNDVVLAFDGCKPTIINEDPTPGGTWLLVCEDLGGSFDTDYNDVIFKVEHISGQEFINVTAMAAGGTLASYIVFNDPTQGGTTQDFVVGEIHEMFNVGRMPSGAYEPINALTSRWEASGITVTIPVHKDWQIAYNVDAQEYLYDNMKNSNEVNMGGFRVYTLPAGTEITSATPTFNELSAAKASVIAAPEKGDAPYILCLPYTYTKVNDDGTKKYTCVWAWPLELCTICSAAYDQNGKYSGSNGGAYLQFAEWVRNSKYAQSKDWYKHKNENGLTVETWIVKEEEIPQGVSIDPKDDNKLEANFGTWAQYAYGDWANIWPFTGEGKKWPFYTGDKIVIYARNWTSEATGTISATFEDVGNTGSTMTANGSDYTITMGPNAGLAKLRIHYEGDSNYKPADILITLQVKAAEVVRFCCWDSNGQKKALSHVVDNGADVLKLVGSNQSDANQQWRLEDTGNSLFLLLNMATRKYLKLRANNDGHGDFVTKAYNEIKVDGYYRYELTSDNRLRVREHNRTGHELNLSFGTDNPIGDNVTVFMDKGGKNGGNVIYWEKNTVTSFNAKARPL